MKLHRIYALVVRYMYLYRRSLPRMMEIFYWPFLDLVIWGFITVYLMKFQGQIPGVVTFFLGALILWDILFRAQQGVTISFLEEIWARNLMNLFASPLKPSEFLAATMVMSVLKVMAVSVVMVVCAGLFYSVQYLCDWDVADSLRLESRNDGMDYWSADYGSHHAIWPGSGSPGLEHGIHVPAHLLCVLSDGRAPWVAAGHCLDEPGCPCV